MKPYPFGPVLRARYQPLVSSCGTPAFTHDQTTRSNNLRTTRPATNIIRMENGYQIQLAVPGIPKDQIQVRMIEDQLVVSASVDKQETPARFVRQEFDFNGFKRSFTLPKNADVDNLKAAFEQGVLTITILDKAPQTRKIEIL